MRQNKGDGKIWQIFLLSIIKIGQIYRFKMK
jgi:hypothetical protein